MIKPYKSHGFIADYCFDRAVDIDPIWIKKLGIHGVLLDIDNTLCRWEVRTIPEAEMEWLGRLQASGLACLMLSNGIPSKVRGVVDQAGIKHVTGRPMKPLPYGFKRGLRELGMVPDEVMMIGDSVIPDVFGANQVGIWTCLVNPLSNIDFPGSKFWRLAEKMFRLRHPSCVEQDFRSSRYSGEG